jgi:hypothetical protein
MSTPPPIQNTQGEAPKNQSVEKQKKRERCQNPNRVRNIRKKE